MIKLLKAERMKLKRSPLWLVFLLMPILPAILGTMNYMNNLELLKSEWYSLWTQHTLFTCYFFMPVMIGIYCAYLTRIEHNNHNWNKVLTMPYNRSSIFIAKTVMAAGIIFMTELWIGVIYIIVGNFVGLSNPPYLTIITRCLFGTLGGIVMAEMELLLSMYIKSFALPVGISFAGGISGMVFIAKKLGHIWPYSLMEYGMNANNNNQQLEAAGQGQFILISLLYIAFFTFMGAVMIRKKDL